MATRLYSVAIFKQQRAADPVMLTSAQELSMVPILYRGTAKQFVTFYSRTAARGAHPGVRQQLAEEDYRIYTHCVQNGLVAVVCANVEYPERVALNLCSRIVAGFEDKFVGDFEGEVALKENSFRYPELARLLKEYQDPTSADSILKIRKELDEVTTLMVQNLESVIERGVKISDLVSESNDLTDASKSFYKTARKTNKRCCVIM